MGKEKEAELWAAARQFVERINQAHPREQTGVKGEGDLESMEVD